MPSALYLHVPFCVRRCLYCDFYVLPLGEGAPAQRLQQFRSLKHRGFLQAMDRELAQLPKAFQPRTLYIGGGTPTELPPEALSQLFASVRRHVDLSQVDEFSCEANPGTLDDEMAELLIREGVNRVSLGVQSFDNAMLERLGRIHNAEEAVAGVELLRNAGVDNLSIDVLFALPESARDGIQINLEQLEELNPEHVSWYSLEWETGTAFEEMRQQGFLQEPDPEESAAEYEQIRSGLSALGYQQYELFSFTRPGYACEHNMNYWLGGEYYGCGPSAHSHVAGKRWQRPADLQAYVRGDLGETDAEHLQPEAKAREALMTGLRLCEGLDEAQFSKRFGYSPAALIGKNLELYQSQGWLEQKGGKLKLLPEAYLLSDSLFRDLIL